MIRASYARFLFDNTITHPEIPCFITALFTVDALSSLLTHDLHTNCIHQPLHRPAGGIYCASKASLSAWSDALRVEVEPFGVQVTVLTPGIILSNIYNKALPTDSSKGKQWRWYGYLQVRVCVCVHKQSALAYTTRTRLVGLPPSQS